MKYATHNMTQNSPNVVVRWLIFLLRIRRGPISNNSLKTDYFERVFPIHTISSRSMPGKYDEFCHKTFLLPCLMFITRTLIILPLCYGYQPLKASLNKARNNKTINLKKLSKNIIQDTCGNYDP
jgi:hypothetical protein